MKKNFFLFAVSILFSFNLVASDSAYIKLVMPGNGRNYNFSDAVVYSYQKERLMLYTYVKLKGEETVFAYKPESKTPEMLRIMYNTKESKFIDIWVPDGDTTIIKIAPDDNLQTVIKGDINKDFVEFKVEKINYLSQLEVLKEEYNSEVNHKKKEQVLKKLNELHKDIEGTIWYFSNKNKTNVLGQYFYNQWYPKGDFSKLESLQKASEIEKFWKNVNLTDYDLLKTDLYSSLIERYVSLFFEEDYMSEQQDSAIKSAVRVVMNKFSESELHQNYAFNFLLKSFNQIQYAELERFMEMNYSNPDQCDTDDDAPQKINESVDLKPGNFAPNIVITDIDNVEFTIKDLEADSVLVIFFSSMCPHCTEAMPHVKDMLKGRNIYVVAISADVDANKYFKYIKKYPDWRHSCDFLAGRSPMIKAFGVRSTPLMFMFDKDRRLINKYRTWQELKFALDVN